MERREKSDVFRDIAEGLIKSESALSYIKLSTARIVYLESDSAKKVKGRAVLGECEKIASKNQWAIPYDFSITLFAPNIVTLSDEQVRIVLFHELLHVGIDVDDNGEEVFSVRPHDYEEFREIIEKYGLDWTAEGFEAPKEALLSH